MTERARMAVVVGDSLDGDTLQALGAACARLHAGVQLWDGRRLPDDGAVGDVGDVGARPALVVAGLAAGARHLSEEILELADRQFPGTEVLLVCNEPLVRPMLTLQQGRLTLIEPPATVDRMASRIRLLLADEPAVGAPRAGIVGLAPPEHGSFAGHEFRRRDWWAGGLACAGSQDDPPAPRPWLGLETGMTAVLTSGADPVDEATIEHAIDLVSHDPDGDDRDALLGRTLGPRAGLIHLTADSMSWLIYWPCSWQPLWLFSTQRLPRWSDLTRNQDLALRRVPAVAGDVIAGLSSAESFADGSSALPATVVSAAMLEGGPALLALFEARMAAAPRPFSSVLAEVR